MTHDELFVATGGPVDAPRLTCGLNRGCCATARTPTKGARNTPGGAALTAGADEAMTARNESAAGAERVTPFTRAELLGAITD